MTSNIIVPGKTQTFTCPFCKAFAQFEEIPCCRQREGGEVYDQVSRELDDRKLDLRKCMACGKHSLFLVNDVIFPEYTELQISPNKDMPDKALQIYKEASSTLRKSPRAAAALLRLCLELILKDIGKVGTLKQMIEEIDLKDESLIKSCHILRLSGNNAVHSPKEIQVGDDGMVALSLFKLINIICEKLISEKKMIDELWKGLSDE